jgi:hypothetical protein
MQLKYLKSLIALKQNKMKNKMKYKFDLKKISETVDACDKVWMLDIEDMANVMCVICIIIKDNLKIEEPIHAGMTDGLINYYNGNEDDTEYFDAIEDINVHSIDIRKERILFFIENIIHILNGCTVEYLNECKIKEYKENLDD